MYYKYSMINNIINDFLNDLQQKLIKMNIIVKVIK